MESIFNLESYKDYLISYFGNKGDQTRREARKKYVESHYSDEELNTIVVNTEMFVLSILKEIYLQIDSFEKTIGLKKKFLAIFVKIFQMVVSEDGSQIVYFVLMNKKVMFSLANT